MTESRTDNWSNAWKTRSAAGDGQLLVVLGISLILIAVATVTSAYLRNAQLERGGDTAPGTVIDLTTERDDDFHVRYRYEAPLSDGETRVYFHEEKVSERVFYSLEPGDQVAVTYVSDRPEVSTVGGVQGHSAPSPLWGVAILAGLFFIMRGLTVLRTNRGLEVRHSLAQGTVVDCWLDTDSEGETICFIDYHFEACHQDGKAECFRGASIIDRKAGLHLQAGDRVSVHYLPGDPGVNSPEL